MLSNNGTKFLFVLFLPLLLISCDSSSSASDEGDGSMSIQTCNIPTRSLVDGGVGKDGIPALTNPVLVEASEVTNFLNEDNRVIGFLIDGEAIAVPHNILWWHEIVNFDFASKDVAISYCPLTGSSIGFDRATIGGAEFGVSGLLFQNNLTMYDRNSLESLWPQMMLQGACGPEKGQALETVAVLETSWAGWKDLYPNTKVIDAATGFNRNYSETGYPYGDYEVESNARLLFNQDVDKRRGPKERILGLPSVNGGVAYPFNELNKVPVRVIEEIVSGEEVVVFWSRAHEGAMAYRKELNGQPISFQVKNEMIVDIETGSQWRLDGLAISGNHAGAQLEPLSDAIVSFWFAWAAFSPGTRIWKDFVS